MLLQKAEYEAEGIDHSMIEYSDNASVLEVFDKPKAGIFAFLEEQCLIQTGRLIVPVDTFLCAKWVVRCSLRKSSLHANSRPFLEA